MKDLKSTTVADGNIVSETITAGQESSVEIDRNAKGDVKIVVKCYHADIEIAANQALVTYRFVLDQVTHGIAKEGK